MPKWTKEEEERLVKLVARRGRCWNAIGNILGRTEGACYKKYFECVSDVSKRGQWDPREEQELFKALFEGAESRARTLGRSKNDVRVRLKRWKKVLIREVFGGVDFEQEERKAEKKREVKGDVKGEVKGNGKERMGKIKREEFCRVIGAEEEKWGKEEDESIFRGYDWYGLDWESVSEGVPRRSPKEIKEHFFMTLKWAACEYKHDIDADKRSLSSKFPNQQIYYIEQPLHTKEITLLPLVPVAKFLLGIEDNRNINKLTKTWQAKNEPSYQNSSQFLKKHIPLNSEDLSSLEVISQK